ENGGVLFDPGTRQVDDLADPPPPALLAGLEHLGVPFSTGRIIISTVVPHEREVLTTIRSLGLEFQIIFNKESVMVLPSGVSKESGLRAALQRLGLSLHNTVGVGDAENDHAFLARTGFAVAVANARPALSAQADLVTTAPAGAGVRELIDGALLSDLVAFRPRLLARTVSLGVAQDGHEIRYPVRGPNLLITGDSGMGKSTLAGVLVERLVHDDYVICVLDPEGEFRTLSDHEGIVGLSSEAGDEATPAGEG